MKKRKDGVTDEIEDRWHTKKEDIPEWIWQGIKEDKFRMLFIHQGYMLDQRGSRLRDELENDMHKYFLTWKEGEGVKRPEHEYGITVKRFLADWRSVAASLWKIRYLISLGDYAIELNFFIGALYGYIQIEREYDTMEQQAAFVAPLWFGKKVTDDKSHGNYSLAFNGLPKEGL